MDSCKEAFVDNVKIRKSEWMAKLANRGLSLFDADREVHEDLDFNFHRLTIFIVRLVAPFFHRAQSCVV